MKIWARASYAAALAGLCGQAAAHSPIKGIGHFYAGVLHPMVVPAHLMALIATGLWLARRWPADAAAWAAVATALPLGLAAGALAPWPGAERGVLLLAAAIAAACAAALPVPRWLAVTVAAVLGVLLGIDSLPEGLSGRPLWLALSGSWLGVVLAIGLVLALGDAARQPWMKIAQRVVASWLAAAAILVLALAWFVPVSALTAVRSAAATEAAR